MVFDRGHLDKTKTGLFFHSCTSATQRQPKGAEPSLQRGERWRGAESPRQGTRPAGGGRAAPPPAPPAVSSAHLKAQILSVEVVWQKIFSLPPPIARQPSGIAAAEALGEEPVPDPRGAAVRRPGSAARPPFCFHGRAQDWDCTSPAPVGDRFVIYNLPKGSSFGCSGCLQPPPWKSCPWQLRPHSQGFALSLSPEPHPGRNTHLGMGTSQCLAYFETQP